MRRLLVALLIAAPSVACGQTVQFDGRPELVAPGAVSTAATEVKLAFSPDGRWMLWGVIGRDGGAGGWDIYLRHRTGDSTWTEPVSAPFNSPQNDFDPAFRPDGRGVIFFSNRPGGLGGDDLYEASFDPKTGQFGAARNLGPTVNSAGDEWGPSVSPDGRTLLFCTDGRGGAGKHDLFVSTRRRHGWGPARRLTGPINGPLDDFDPSFLHDGRTIVFAREVTENVSMLHVASRSGRTYSAPVALDSTINVPEMLNFGPSINLAEPGWFYYSTQHPDLKVGRIDLYRVRYRLAR